MKRIRTYKLLDAVSVVIIILVIFIIGMFLYIRFWPVDVIKNDTWVLCTSPLTEHNGVKRCEAGFPDFQVGQTIPVYVNSDKIKNVGGTFIITAECKNEAGLFVNYPISEQHTNFPKGHVETTIYTKVSNKIPHLPATCRIAFVLEYDIYAFRSFSEYNFTNEFSLSASPASTLPPAQQ